MRNTIQKHAFQPAQAYLARIAGFSKGGNVSDVVVGGVCLAAPAIMDEVPKSAQVVSDLFKNGLSKGREPDRVGAEGPMYWGYAVRYAVPLLAAMNSALGADFGLSDTTGMRGTGAYAIYGTGPSGASFGYSDSHSRGMHTQELLWLASRYDTPAYGWQALNRLPNETKPDKKTDETQNEDADNKESAVCVQAPFRFLWAQPENYHPPTERTFPLARLFKGEVELAFFRSAWNDPNALFVGMKGGENWGGHGDLDIGDFVLDVNGVQWAVELGANSYNSPSYFDRTGPRWDYYRKRAEGQNTLVINPGKGPDRQHGIAPFESFSDAPGDFFAVLNMTSPYSEAANSVKRGVRLADEVALLQDEIETTAPADVFWFMHTRAEIALEDGGKKARLSQDGKTLVAQCLSPENAAFTVMQPVPLPGAPNPPENNPNKGVQKLAISLPQVSKACIVVTFTTEKDGHAPPHMPLSLWR